MAECVIAGKYSSVIKPRDWLVRLPRRVVARVAEIILKFASPIGQAILGLYDGDTVDRLEDGDSL